MKLAVVPHPDYYHTRKWNERYQVGLSWGFLTAMKLVYPLTRGKTIKESQVPENERGMIFFSVDKTGFLLSCHGFGK